jgi:RNA polymerase sigma-70 factor (ECF subfamily)
VSTGTARTGTAGNDAARRARLEQVAAEVYEPLQRYLSRRANRDDAADVLADTLLVVWRRLDEVPDEPLPWCYGVARRTLANHRRGDDRRLRLVQRTAAQPTPPASGDPQLAVEHGDPELGAAIATLSETEQEIVHLWAWERLEPREIAAVLDTTPNAVSVALSRAKRKLAERLEPGRQDRPDAGHLHGAGATEAEGDGR